MPVLGHETPGENRDGTLAFEAGADKQRGGQGWADVIMESEGLRHEVAAQSDR